MPDSQRDQLRWFPSDFGWKQWQNGRYWFDTYIDTYHQTRDGKPIAGGEKYSHFFNLDYWKVFGEHDPAENLVLSAPKLKVSTKALPGNASTANATPVYDSISISNESNYDVKVTGTSTTLRFKNGSIRKAKTLTKESKVTIPAKSSRTIQSSAFIPATLFGSGNWRKGQYAFDVSISRSRITNAHEDSVGAADIVLRGTSDPAEQFVITYSDQTFSTVAKNTFTRATGRMAVHDDVKSTADMDVSGTVTLNLDTNGDGRADHSARSKSFTIKAWSTSSSPDFTPSSLGLDSWVGGKYWFDLDIPVQANVDTAIHLPGYNNGQESWSATGMESMTAWTTSQAMNGLVAGWNQADVTAGTKFTASAGNLVVAGGTQTLTDQVRLNVKSLTGDRRSWDTNNDGRFDGSLRFTVRTVLHGPNGKSTAKSLDYDSYHSAAGGGVMNFDFTPSDLGLAKWTAGDYWFTSVVTGVKGVSDTSGLSCPAGQLAVNGVKGDHLLCLKDYKTESSPLAGSENMHMTPGFQPSVSTKVTDKTLDSGYPSWDDVTVTLPAGVSGLSVPVKGTLYWSPTKGAKSDKVPANAKPVGQTMGLTFKATGFRKNADGKHMTQTIRYKAGDDPKLKNVSRLGTGWYTFVFSIDRQALLGQRVTVSWDWRGKGWTKSLTYPSDQLLAGMPGTVSDGWDPDNEQTTMSTKWTPSVVKVGHVGGRNGAWMDKRPAAGARLSLQETTDATGRTLKTGAPRSDVTLDKDGRGSFAAQVIGPGETRYYRVWETKVDKPFNVPENNGYWIITATQRLGATGVKTVMTKGSTDETNWLVRDSNPSDPSSSASHDTADHGTSQGSGVRNDPSSWTQTLGDTMDANVMPPSTGGTRDVLRMLLGVGMASLVAVAAGLIAVRRLHGADPR